MPLPTTFNGSGLLDPGTYEATINDIRKSILVGTENKDKGWDAQWRLQLINNAEVLIKQLWQVDITEIFLDGSFVENKEHPNDIDGYFDTHLKLHDFDDNEKYIELISKLNDLDPHKIWNWSPSSRRPYRGYSKSQLPMWHVYRVEFYPHRDQDSGIRDKFGNNLKFPAAFRQSKNGFKEKGIIKVIPEEN